LASIHREKYQHGAKCRTPVAVAVSPLTAQPAQGLLSPQASG
jgi:hypothetical protein